MILSNFLSGSLFGERRTSHTSRQPRWKPRWLSDPSAQDEHPQGSSWRERLLAYQPGPSNSLLAASTAAAFSWAGGFFMLPGLQLISIPITLVVAVPIAREAIDAVRQQAARGAVISIVGVVGALALHQPAGAALIEVAHFAVQSISGKRGTLWGRSATEPVPADTDVYIVRSWEEDDGAGRSTKRYVLESPDASARHGFTQLSDLISTLRGMIAPSPQA